MSKDRLREAEIALDFWNHGPKDAAVRSLSLSLLDAERRGWFAGARFSARAILAVNVIWALAYYWSR